MTLREAVRIPGMRLLAATVRRGRSTAVETLQDARFQLKRARRGRLIEGYLRAHSVRKLHLGTGSNAYDGWLNTDITDFRRLNRVVYLDARKPFPLPDNSIDVVFSEHMIEHLTYAEGQHCLAECHRVLRPGGRIRIATPSIDRLLKLYEPVLTDLEHRYMRWSIETFVKEADAVLPGFVLNNIFRNFGHQFVYDHQTLGHALETAGFVDIESWPTGRSGDERLVGLERHMRNVAEFNEFETLGLEARRA
jgi:predicted SAM-dependent methyltransferase